MHEYLVHNLNGTTIPITAKNYRVDKNGTLFIIGRGYKTIAAYPSWQWTSIEQTNEQTQPQNS